MMILTLAGDKDIKFRYLSDETEDVTPLTHSMSGKELAGERKNGNLRWLRPDGKTQVTIEYVPKVVGEIIEVVRLIPQERVQQRTVEQIVHVPVPQVVEEIAEVVQIIPRSVSRSVSSSESSICQW